MIFAAEKSTFYRCWNGQQAQQDPKPQRCPQGDGQGSSKAQMCDGGDLTGQNGGHRMIPAKAAGEKKHQHSGDDAVEELPEEVCAGGESTFSDKREYLTVNGQTQPRIKAAIHSRLPRDAAISRRLQTPEVISMAPESRLSAMS